MADIPCRSYQFDCFATGAEGQAANPTLLESTGLCTAHRPSNEQHEAVLFLVWCAYLREAVLSDHSAIMIQDGLRGAMLRKTNVLGCQHRALNLAEAFLPDSAAIVV